MEEEEKKEKRPLDLNWETLLPSQDDEPPLVLVVEQESPTIEEPQQQQQTQRDDVEYKTDHELNDLISRHSIHVESLGPKLPDKGAKLRANLQRLMDERERRKLCRVEKDADICEKPTQSHNSSFCGASEGSRQVTPSSQAHPQSSFASHLRRMIDENEADCRTVDAFDKEPLQLRRCDRRKMKMNGQHSHRGRQRTRQSLREASIQSSSSISLDRDKNICSNGDRKGRAASTCSLRHLSENLPVCSPKKRSASQVLPSNDSRQRKGQTVVLLDEEEPQLIETNQQATKITERMKETKIYYPSREDPESVEILYSDIACLAPQAYLTSPIMNFYIQYLQQPVSPTDRAPCNYHFFNTYFYKKLKEALSYKGSDKETSFIKFRRWWKGVNIFEKAYILLPIHQDHHWSLVIICIPDKEDEAGPIILHLDSLGLHYSRPIFDDIKSYLKEEWKYLNQEADSADLPIADRIWKHLPRRIEEKVIAVPQQKNDYDCGLFVLFFMERFIEEAPERLKKKDLAMFGKQWFKPEEASGLRVKIQNLLMKELQNASENN